MDTAKLRARALLGCPLTDYERAFFLLFVAEEWEAEIFFANTQKVVDKTKKL